MSYLHTLFKEKQGIKPDRFENFRISVKTKIYREYLHAAHALNIADAHK